MILSTVFAALLAAGVASAQTAPACKLDIDRAPGRYCGARGQLRRAAISLRRTYTDYTLAQCKMAIVHDYYLLSMGYNRDTRVCSIYDRPVKNSGYVRNNASPSIFYDEYCFDPQGFCPLSNPSFEDIITGRPQEPYDRESISFAPWGVYQNGPRGGDTQTARSFAQVLNSSSTIGQQAGSVPDGNRFLHMHVSGSRQGGVAQALAVPTGFNYQISFAYNLFKIVPSDDPNVAPSDYTVDVYLDNDQLLSFSPEDTNVWHTQTIPLADANIPDGGGLSGFLIQITPPEGAAAKYADFLLDDIQFVLEGAS